MGPKGAQDEFGTGVSRGVGHNGAQGVAGSSGSHLRPKRKLGEEVDFLVRKKALTGQYGLVAGQQVRKGFVEPLFKQELEPGQAVEQALNFTHPFAQEVELEQSLNTVMMGLTFYLVILLESLLKMSIKGN